MYHKTIPFRRTVRRNHVAKRIFIAQHCMYWPSLIKNERRRGQLAKGKVHCSCPLCSNKSTQLMGVKTNSTLNYSISDKRKLNSLADSYNEYFEDVF